MTTYAQFQDQASSEKVGLVAINAGKRLMGWSVYSGSVYQIPFEHDVIVSLTQNGTTLTSVASLALVGTSKYYLDREARTLYLRTSDSSHPNSKFIGCTTRFFFSNFPIRQPWDLSSGFSVPWRPLLKSTSTFGVGLDNTNLLGFAIEGSGSVTFHNDFDFWSPIYDKYFFEGQQVYVYSWSRTLPITEAKLIYQGRIESKSYSSEQISFNLKDQISGLRGAPTLSLISSLPSASVPNAVGFYRQRLLFGYVSGMRPVNISQLVSATGHELSGTVSATLGSQTITGSSTSFLSELEPDDEIFIAGNSVAYSVESVASNTSLTLTEPYSYATGSSLSISLKSSSRPKNYLNRTFKVAGHALREPSAEITKIYSFTTFEIDDATDFIAGEPLVVNGEYLTIERVSGNRVTTTQAAAFLDVGDTVTIPAIRNVYIDDALLAYPRDFSYSAANAEIELLDLAEFNVAPTKLISGALTFTSSGTDTQKRTVTGSATFFKKELSPGDWVRRSVESDWFEVLSIESDTSLTLKSASTYSGTGAAYKKQPKVYVEGQSVLSCDALGCTLDGTTGGVFLNTAPRIIKYLLQSVGLGDLINTASFDFVDSLNTPRLGIALPSKYSDSTVPTVRDVINTINQSVFGTLYQTSDFQLAYSVLAPKRPPTMSTFKKHELLSWELRGESQNIIKTVSVSYDRREHNPENNGPSDKKVESESEQISRLTNIQRSKEFSTYLVTEADARRLAGRWSFVLGASNGVLSFKLPLSGSRFDVNDIIYIQHEKLCQRFGSLLSRRIGGVSSLKRDIARTTLQIDDVAGAFARCAIITSDDALPYSTAADDDRFINGYITDQYGMINDDTDLFGINLIW